MAHDPHSPIEPFLSAVGSLQQDGLDRAQLTGARSSVATCNGLDEVTQSPVDQTEQCGEFTGFQRTSILNRGGEIYRYVPSVVTVRRDDDESQARSIQVIAAAVQAGTRFIIPSGVQLDIRLWAFVTGIGVNVTLESDAVWVDRNRSLEHGRIRLIAGAPAVEIYCNGATDARPIEMLPFMQEQAITILAGIDVAESLKNAISETAVDK